MFLTALVYNEVVCTSNAVAFYLERPKEEKAQWLSKLNAGGWACLIAEQDGVPLGYLSIGTFRISMSGSTG